jgi:hypothetical protein
MKRLSVGAIRLLICGDGRSFGRKQSVLWCIKVIDMKKHKATSMEALYPLAIMNCDEKHENFLKYCKPMLDSMAALTSITHNGVERQVLFLNHSLICLL